MKYKYKRKISENYDCWEDCKISNLMKGDIFYMMAGDQEGPFLTAKTDATLKPSSRNHSKLVWHIETEKISDDNFL